MYAAMAFPAEIALDPARHAKSVDERSIGTTKRMNRFHLTFF
jgi:hypothetical protein